MHSTTGQPSAASNYTPGMRVEIRDAEWCTQCVHEVLIEKASSANKNIGYSPKFLSCVTSVPKNKKWLRSSNSKKLPASQHLIRRPHPRTAQHYAPFFMPDREQDYHRAWAFFEKEEHNTKH